MFVCFSADFSTCPLTTSGNPEATLLGGVCDLRLDDKLSCSFPTAPPVLYEYLISVELKVSDVAELSRVKTILSNITYPINIDDHVQISEVNISTGT